jgi:hypothetical protein
MVDGNDCYAVCLVAQIQERFGQDFGHKALDPMNAHGGFGGAGVASLDDPVSKDIHEIVGSSRKDEIDEGWTCGMLYAGRRFEIADAFRSSDDVRNRPRFHGAAFIQNPIDGRGRHRCCARYINERRAPTEQESRHSMPSPPKTIRWNFVSRRIQLVNRNDVK